MELPQRYPYNPKWGVIIFCAVFFGACAVYMGFKAANNTVGVIIDGVITLGPVGATRFYWVIAGIGAGFVVLAFLLTVRRIASSEVFELGTDALLLPHGRFQRQTSRIAYSDIQSISEVQVSGQTFLYVIVGGRKFTIIASLFPSMDSYVAVREFLVSRAPR